MSPNITHDTSLVWTNSLASEIDLPEGAWIVLGFLLDGEGPRSGYDLQAQAARSVAHFWPITKAHVYSALPKLERAGCVTSQKIEQASLPDKLSYAATEDGAKAFAGWLMDADLGSAKLRHPLLVKAFFGGSLPSNTLGDFLTRYEQQCLQKIAAFRALLSRPSEEAPQNALFRQLSIRHGVIALEGDLAWIGEVRDTLKIK